MAITIDVTNAEVLTPDELLDWAINNVDPRDEEGMVAAGAKLYSLYNNRNFLVGDLTAELLDIAQGRSGRQTSPQAFIHGHRERSGNHFTVRSVSWTPPLTKVVRSKAIQEKTFSYTSAHDHNFALMTVGYAGPGYETTVFEYINNDLVGYEGEIVNLNYLETTTLTEGKVMFYRPLRDVHAQNYPSEVSISVNLIGESPDITSTSQYEFDTKSGQIIGLLSENTVSRQLVPFDIATTLGVDDNIVDLMLYIAQKHKAAQTRKAAWNALIQLRPELRKDFYDLIAQDRHPLLLRCFNTQMMANGSV